MLRHTFISHCIFTCCTFTLNIYYKSRWYCSILINCMFHLHTFIHRQCHLWVCVCYFGCVSVEYPCVHGRCCRFLSVVSGPKVSGSTVTFGPSQGLLCLTTMVWGSSSADDTRTLQCGLHVSREQSDRVGLRNGSRHRGHGAKGPWRESQGWSKHRQGDGG